MKILFVIPTLLKAGAERMLVNICNELAKNKNIEVAIFLIWNANEYVNELDKRVHVESGGIEFKFSMYRKDIIINKKYVDFVTSYSPDIIHSHLYYGDLLAHSYFHKSSIYISHLQNSIIEEYNGLVLKDIFKRKMWANLYEYKWVMKRYKKFNTNFIACSDGAKEFHNKYIKLGKIVTLPNASSMPKIEYKYKVMNKAITIIWVGRLTDVKRPQMAIKIAEKLKNNGLNFKLKIAGFGSEKDNCLSLIKDLGLNDYIQMVGLIDDMESFYKEADIMIHTAIYEGLPLVFIEANSYGIPIITTDCMPNNEFIDDKKNGFIIKSENPLDYFQIINKMLQDPGYYQKISNNSIEYSKKFSIENFTNKMLNYYSELTNS